MILLLGVATCIYKLKSIYRIAENFRGRKFCEFYGSGPIRESFLREHRMCEIFLFVVFAKVFSLENFPLYGNMIRQVCV